MLGSRSSGSSGPRPKTSSRMSLRICLALGHADRRRFLGHQLEDERANLGLGALPVDGRERLEVQPVEQLAVNVALQLDVLRPWRVRSRYGRGHVSPTRSRARSPAVLGSVSGGGHGNLVANSES